MQNETSLFEMIREIIAGQLQIAPEEIRMDSLIVEELQADSIDIVEILTVFEERYLLTVSDEEIASFKTPGDILAYLTENCP